MAGSGDRGRTRSTAVVLIWVVALALPLVGLASLLLRRELDPHFENYRAHFVIFGAVGVLAFVLGYTAGEAANRRGDARVLLLSLAFMATGGFMGLHAFGTAGVLFTQEHSGFQVAIPVGLLVSAVFAFASAFVDLRPGVGPWLVRRRTLLRAFVLAAMGGWLVWTVLNLPPLRAPDSEAARGSFLAVMAIVGTLVYAVSAVRYWLLFREERQLLPVAVIACFLLLSEAMIGVAVTGERTWHASWWEWHGLIVIAYLIIGLAARREWREERFRHLVPPVDPGASSGHQRPVRRPRRVHAVLGARDFRRGRRRAERVLEHRGAADHPSVRGELEKFIGDSIAATFNSRGDQPDHAVRAARAALALQTNWVHSARCIPPGRGSGSA